MFNFLMRFTNSGKISAATEEEQRACLEAVVLTLAGDRRLSMVEEWEFRQLIKRIGQGHHKKIPGLKVGSF